jgi:hypothetical protein
VTHSLAGGLGSQEPWGLIFYYHDEVIEYTTTSFVVTKNKIFEKALAVPNHSDVKYHTYSNKDANLTTKLATSNISCGQQEILLLRLSTNPYG